MQKKPPQNEQAWKRKWFETFSSNIADLICTIWFLLDTYNLADVSIRLLKFNTLFNLLIYHRKHRSLIAQLINGFYSKGRVFDRPKSLKLEVTVQLQNAPQHVWFSQVIETIKRM